MIHDSNNKIAMLIRSIGSRHRANTFGFTIIELLMALGIVVVLTVVVAVNFRVFKSASALRAEAEELASVLRRAQLWALTGQTRSGSRPPGGWGLRLEECSAGSCSYLLFADLGLGDHLYNDPGDSSDEVALSFTISDQVRIMSLTPSTPLDIVFSSPFSSPDTDSFINGLQTAAEAVITLEQPGQSIQQTITLDRVTGRINVE